jgi:hypothetical protein
VGAEGCLAALAQAAICTRILARPLIGAEEEPAVLPGPLSSIIVPPSHPFSFLNNALEAKVSS